MEPDLVIGSAAQSQGQVSAIAEGFSQAAHLQGASVVGVIGNKDGDHALGVVA